MYIMCTVYYVTLCGILPQVSVQRFHIRFAWHFAFKYHLHMNIQQQMTSTSGVSQKRMKLTVLMHFDNYCQPWLFPIPPKHGHILVLSLIWYFKQNSHPIVMHLGVVITLCYNWLNLMVPHMQQPIYSQLLVTLIGVLVSSCYLC